MRMNFHNDDECYLLFGKELNQIIAMLGILSERNPDVENLSEFIQKLKTMRSYDDMLDEMIFKTSGKLKDEPPMTKDEALRDSMTLNEILSRLDITLPKDKK